MNAFAGGYVKHLVAEYLVFSTFEKRQVRSYECYYKCYSSWMQRNMIFFSGEDGLLWKDQKITLKVNESQYKQCGVTPHFSTGQNVFKKYWEKMSIDIINSEKLFDRSSDHK